MNNLFHGMESKALESLESCKNQEHAGSFIKDQVCEGILQVSMMASKQEYLNLT